MTRKNKNENSERIGPILLNEKPLKDQLDLKDRALATSAEGITIADATQSDCPLIYVNQGFETLTGYSAAYACGSNCRFLQGKDTDPTAVEEIRRAVRQKRGCVVEILNYRKNGEPFWNRLSITPIYDDSGVVTHFIGIQSDVTARRKAEDELRAAKFRLEKANNLIKRDLEMAADIQKSFLPPRQPILPGVKAAWELLACDELAGDTLNVSVVDDRYVIFYVVDVSGHGVQAALLSVTLNHWLSPIAGQSGPDGDSRTSVLSPIGVLNRLNRQFPIDPKIGQYFTIVYGVLDTQTFEFRFATAGHPPPVYIPSGEVPAIQQCDNFPIGVVPEPDFRERTIRMNRGDRILLYSDGLVDAADAADTPFGVERFLDQCTHIKSVPLQNAVPDIVERLRAWSGKQSFQDDVSLLGFEIT